MSAATEKAEAKAAADKAAEVAAAEAKAAADKAAAAEPDPATEVDTGDREYVVRVIVTGTRNGSPWPSVGELIELPFNEAESYLLAGYIALPEAE